MWLAGWGAPAGGFVFQALALHVGQLSVVQPLLVTELVFALALRRVWLRQSIRGITWGAAALTCVCLSVFLAMSEPEGGTHYPDSSAWATGAWGTVGAATVLALLGMRGSVVRRTPVYALAGAGLGATRLAVGSVAFAVMCGSVVMLTRTAPPTMSSHSTGPSARV